MQKYLVFSLGQKETYAIDIAEVIEIRELVQPTPSPKMASYAKGFAPFRNTIMTVFSVAKRFGLEESNPSRTVVVFIGDNVVGLDVDKVHNIIELGENDQVVPYSSLGFDANSCITHVIKIGKDDSLISIVDLQRIVV